ncbi:MAG: ferrochelatase [Bacteroidia bacterium]
MAKEAILLINLGSPDNPTPGKVRSYLSQFLNDRRVIDINPVGRFFLVNFVIVPFRSFASSKLYQKIWTDKGSPLITYTEELKEKLQALVGQNVLVEMAMRYKKPSIESALEKIRVKNPACIHVLPLYPQYASSSTGSSIENLLCSIRKWEVFPKLIIHSNFYNHPAYLKAIIENGQKFNHNDFDYVVFSYHGLPERQILKASAHYGKNSCSLSNCCDQITETNNFCYRANCFATTRELVKALNIPENKYVTSFQSRLDNKWLKPYSDKVIEELAKEGKKNILVFSPAFVADCLETIHEIETEYLEIFQEHGGEKLTLVPSLNSGDNWVKAIQSIIYDKN